MPEKDQLFSNMHQAALQRLQGRSPEEVARRANADFDGTAFHLKTLGQAISISYPGYQVTPRLRPWHLLTLLHYLATADGTPLSGQPITFAQHAGGMVRGGGFDRDAEGLIATRLGLLSETELLHRIHRLGGERLPSNADLCAGFFYLPNYPVYLKLWFGDDEFPASGRLLLDASAPHYLSIEDAVTVGSLILESLCSPA